MSATEAWRALLLSRWSLEVNVGRTTRERNASTAVQAAEEQSQAF